MAVRPNAMPIREHASILGVYRRTCECHSIVRQEPGDNNNVTVELRATLHHRSSCRVIAVHVCTVCWFISTTRQSGAGRVRHATTTILSWGILLSHASSCSITIASIYMLVSNSNSNVFVNAPYFDTSNKRSGWSFLAIVWLSLPWRRKNVIRTSANKRLDFLCLTVRPKWVTDISTKILQHTHTHARTHAYWAIIDRTTRTESFHSTLAHMPQYYAFIYCVAYWTYEAKPSADLDLSIVLSAYIMRNV